MKLNNTTFLLMFVLFQSGFNLCYQSYTGPLLDLVWLCDLKRGGGGIGGGGAGSQLTTFSYVRSNVVCDYFSIYHDIE